MLPRRRHCTCTLCGAIQDSWPSGPPPGSDLPEVLLARDSADQWSANGGLPRTWWALRRGPPQASVPGLPPQDEQGHGPAAELVGRSLQELGLDAASESRTSSVTSCSHWCASRVSPRAKSAGAGAGSRRCPCGRLPRRAAAVDCRQAPRDGIERVGSFAVGASGEVAVGGRRPVCCTVFLAGRCFVAVCGAPPSRHGLSDFRE